MEDKDLEIIIGVIEKTVERVVNGKIDRLDKKVDQSNKSVNKKLDAHMELTKPMIDFIEGARITGTLIKWAASIVVALGAAYAAIKGITK